jgi:hypothetical protein
VFRAVIGGWPEGFAGQDQRFVDLASGKKNSSSVKVAAGPRNHRQLTQRFQLAGGMPTCGCTHRNDRCQFAVKHSREAAGIWVGVHTQISESAEKPRDLYVAAIPLRA